MTNLEYKFKSLCDVRDSVRRILNFRSIVDGEYEAKLISNKEWLLLSDLVIRFQDQAEIIGKIMNDELNDMWKIKV